MITREQLLDIQRHNIRNEFWKEISWIVAGLVEQLGGEATVSRRLIVDPPELIVSENHIENTITLRLVK